MTEYDRWLDNDLEAYWGDEDNEPRADVDFDGPYPDDDYANYDGWDDMQ